MKEQKHRGHLKGKKVKDKKGLKERKDSEEIKSEVWRLQ